MTCADCKDYSTCDYEFKSLTYDEDKDSIANYCDEFNSIHEPKEIIKNGIVVHQTPRGGIYAYDEKTGKLIYHALCYEMQTDEELDLLSPIDTVVPAKGSISIDTGVHIELPPNTAGFLKSKSGLNVKYGITSEGVIDVGYNGSIVCKLYNHSNLDYEIKRGDKITQLVVMKIDIPELNVVDEFKETERGNGGFGSTGR